MHQLSRLRRHLITAAAGFTLVAPMAQASGAPAHAMTAAAAVAPRDVTTVTVEDVTASNQKIAMAYGALSAMWQDDFKQIGRAFVTPRIARYRGAARTACGVMGGNNAAYCPGDNVIYYDDVFVAGQAKNAAAQVGTDGDMAAVGIIAHEMGHAVALQLGHEWQYTYQNEATADCLAGAFTHRAKLNGELEKGDEEEAFYAMFSAGDPEPELTGNARVDRRIMVNAALMGHGTYDKRMANFKSGLDGGAQACLPDFKGIE